MAKERTTEHTDNIMAHLSDLSNRHDESGFLSALQSLDWSSRPADDVLHAVQLALMTGAFMAARRLAQEGAKRYPDQAELQKYARVLAPPRVIARGLPPRPDLRANRQWIQQNGPAYRGRWIAVRDGQLLGTAESFDALAEQVPERHHVLLTRVS